MQKREAEKNLANLIIPTTTYGMVVNLPLMNMSKSPTRTTQKAKEVTSYVRN